MADRVKGITIQIGGDTTGLSKALSGVNREIGSTQNQLRDVERLLKMDPGNTELLRQKYQLLTQEVEQTENKLNQLKEAEKQVQQQFQRGEIGEAQYNALKREIIATETALGKAKSEAKQTEDAINGIDEASVKDVEQAAKQADDALEDAEKSASNFGDYLKAGVIVEGIKGLADTIGGLADETKDYRKIMGSLEVSSEDAGYSADETKSIYQQLFGVLGDSQTAATTTANLQALGLSQEQLTELTDGAIGAWARYGDSIPIDGLAEAINETVKTGTVTGTLADVLNWAGVSEDEFNEKLAACGDESERANLVLQAMSDQGLTQSAQAWRDNNQSMVDANIASDNLQGSLSRIGAATEPAITTVTQGLANLLDWFLNLDPGIRNFIIILGGIAVLAGPVMTAFSTITGAISIFTGATTTGTAAAQGLSKALTFITSPAGIAIGAIVAIIAVILLFGDQIQAALGKVNEFLTGVFAKDWTEVFGDTLGSVLNGFFDIFQGIWQMISGVLSGIIDFVKGIFSGDWERAWNGVKTIFESIFGGLEQIAKAPINGIIWLINKAIGAINWIIDGINSISFDMPDWLGGGHVGFNIGKIGEIAYLAKGGILTQGTAMVGEAGPELLTLANGRAVVQPLSNHTTNNTSNLGGVSIYVYGAPGQDVNQLADLMMQKFESATRRKAATWG